MRDNLSAVILAGGKNSRMGTHKAFIKQGRLRIIDIILNVLEPLFSEIVIVADEADRFGEFKRLKIVTDLIKDRGPLGGIYTGMKVMGGESGFFVACDMPYLNKNIIIKLMEISGQNPAKATVPRIEGRLEPLHAFYSKELAGEIMSFLESDEKASVRNFLRTQDTRFVDFAPAFRKDFQSVNTGEELKTHCLSQP